MISSKSMRKPQNWQDFESLCKKLWGEIWSCPGIKKNGRLGQNQHGVDVYGLPKGEDAYYGIQCKGKDDYADKVLTTQEIDTEIEKAKSFTPQLKQFIFATTANKDATIEAYIRQKNIESLRSSLFSIDLYSWEDIVELIEENRNVYNWYINDCQYKEAVEISVYPREDTIRPQYYRIMRSYKYSPPSRFTMYPMDLFPDAIVSPFGKSKRDYRWQDIDLIVENTGNVAITDYKLYLYFPQDVVLKLSDKCHYENSMFLSDTVKASINARIDATREVYETDSPTEIHIIPIEKTLVQTDHRSFTLGVKPKDGVSLLSIHWEFKSRDYHQNGRFEIKVEPDYEDKEEVISVERYSDIKETETVIEPKIIEL